MGLLLASVTSPGGGARVLCTRIKSLGHQLKPDIALLSDVVVHSERDNYSHLVALGLVPREQVWHNADHSYFDHYLRASQLRSAAFLCRTYANEARQAQWSECVYVAKSEQCRSVDEQRSNGRQNFGTRRVAYRQQCFTHRPDHGIDSLGSKAPSRFICCSWPEYVIKRPFFATSPY